MQNIRVINLWLMSLNPLKKIRLSIKVGVSSAKGLSRSPNLISKLLGFL